MNNSFRDFELEGWSDKNTCAEYHRNFGTVTIQSVPALLDAANISEGSHVLDMCCGAGYAAGLATERGASAVGIDFSQAQVELATAQYPNATFEQGDAALLQFEAKTFDAVVSSIGIPHFEDPNIPLSEAFRVLRPQGRLAFSVYDVPEKALGFGLIYDAVAIHGTMDIGLPEGPNFFLFSDPFEAESSLYHTGFVEVTFKAVSQTWVLSSVDQLYSAILEGSVRAAATLRGQTEPAQAAIRESVEKELQKYGDEEGYRIPMPVIIVSATRP